MARRTFQRVLVKAIFDVAKASAKSKRSLSRPQNHTGSETEYSSPDYREDINYLEPPDEYLPLKVHQNSYTYPVSGESFQPGTYQTIADANPGVGEVFVEVLLVPCPDNPYDSNAVAVTYENMMLGYVPRATAKYFSELLGDDCGSCSARIYLNEEDFSRCSTELNVRFPPVASWENETEVVPRLESERPDYSFTNLTTKSTKLKKLVIAPGETHEGWAYLNDGYTQKPNIQDEATLEEIGKPNAAISWQFNVFCRSFGGQVLVKYKLTQTPEGKLNLFLDASVLPDFRP